MLARTRTPGQGPPSNLSSPSSLSKSNPSSPYDFLHPEQQQQQQQQLSSEESAVASQLSPQTSGQHHQTQTTTTTRQVAGFAQFGFPGTTMKQPESEAKDAIPKQSQLTSDEVFTRQLPEYQQVSGQLDGQEEQASEALLQQRRLQIQQQQQGHQQPQQQTLAGSQEIPKEAKDLSDDDNKDEINDLLSKIFLFSSIL